MTSMAELAAVLRRGYERFNELSGEDPPPDPEEAAPEFWALLDPGIEVHEPDDLPEPRVFVGFEGYRAITRETQGGFESLRYDVRWVLEAGRHLVVVLRVVGREREGGAGVDLHEAHLWTVAGGRFVRVQGFHGVDDALRAAEELDAGLNA